MADARVICKCGYVTDKKSRNIYQCNNCKLMYRLNRITNNELHKKDEHLKT